MENKLTERDLNTFYLIYQNRCFAMRQLYDFFYSEMNWIDFVDTVIQKWMNLDMVTLIEYKSGEYAVFLAAKAIGLLKRKQLNSVIFDKKTRTIKKGYYSANELLIKNKNISHQLYLVEFLHKIKECFSFPSDMECYDEKQMGKYTLIRPDGMISYHGIDYFVEIDMCTESSKQLREKIRRYSQFFYQCQQAKNQRIVVVFVFKKHVESRILAIKKMIYEEFSYFSEQQFDFVFGDIPEMVQKINLIEYYNQHGAEMEDTIKKHFINQKYLVGNSQAYSNYFHNQFRMYVQLDKSVLTRANQAPYEYVLDIQLGTLSMWNKIMCHRQNIATYISAYKREIPLVMVIFDKEEVITDLLNLKIALNSNIMFVTYEDLISKPFHEAVFGINSQGEYYYTDKSMKFIQNKGGQTL